MKTQIMFAIRDSKGEAYGVPFVKNARGEAERVFTQLRNQKDSTIGQFPEDYDLFEIGTFDPDTGKVVGHDSPRHMVKAVDLPVN